ncbi:hypothetical protein RRG08_027433 [Elysia crispata]|uniref:G-protein coupled receptors family 1 profile domain-containing protein n=1 Tax=Elysia crispata TaxID=231223 RepID=A0AAE1CXJ0_9GAST|nr:hypothetical protein RRG08_027433 [Elysia crispata]
MTLNVTQPCQEVDNVSSLSTGGEFITEAQLYFILMSISTLTQVFSIGGVITNSINIAVFVKLGFNETSNMSLLTLALSDLLSTILTLWGTLCITPGFSDAELPFLPTEIAQLTGAGLSMLVLRCTAWVTAFISFERCLCILIPLKVKKWITPKTTTAVLVAIPIVTIVPSIGMYWRWNFVWKFLPGRNATVLGVKVVNTPFLDLKEKIENIIFGLIQPIVAFVTVLVCTVFLVVYLRRSSQWRISMASAGGKTAGGDNSSRFELKQNISRKEEKVVRLVTSIATIFMVCYTPNTLMFLNMAIFPSFSLFGQHRNVFILLYLVSVLANSVSASVNIFIYYNMGTRYRNALRLMFHFDSEDSVK